MVKGNGTNTFFAEVNGKDYQLDQVTVNQGTVGVGRKLETLLAQ